MNILKKLTISTITTVLLMGSVVGASFAASNPAGTGQPGTPTVSCGVTTSAGNATMEPKGLTTSAFLNKATQVYAGSPGTPSLANGSPKAVSQYDIACYQYTSNH